MNPSLTTQRSADQIHADVPPTSSFSSQLSQVRDKEPVSIPWQQRLILFLKGIPMFSGLLVMATAYWLFFLWDRKNLERRTRHYRLKLSNTWLTYFRPVKVAQWEEWRQSECAHCGACCEILWRCPFLKTEADGNSHCTIHIKRPLPCRTFPIDPHSVELISKNREVERTCSYRFAVMIDQWIEDDKQQKESTNMVGEKTAGSAISTVSSSSLVDRNSSSTPSSVVSSLHDSSRPV